MGVAWELLGEQKVGYGAVVWLCISPGAPRLEAMLPGAAPPSHAQGRVVDPGSGVVPRSLRIGETGQVPEIEVENRGEGALLLPAHTVVTGGWQTRAIERSVVVPGRGSARVPVKCFEAGRWAPRDEKSGSSFSVSDRTSVRTRWSTTQSMLDQLVRHGRFAAEQSAVWQHVDEELSRSPVTSQTRSYEAYLAGVKKRYAEAARKAAIRPPARANGVAIFPRGGGYWIEAYPSAGSFAEQVDDLLADLFDPTTKSELHAHDEASLTALLEGIWRAPLRALDAIPGTLGDSFAFSMSPQAANAPNPLAARPSEQTERNAPSSRSPEVVPSSRPATPCGAVVMIDRAVAHLSIGAPPSHRPSMPGRAEARATARGDAERIAEIHGSDTPASYGTPMVGVEAMRAVYARARDLVPDVSPPRDRVQGYRLVRVFERNISWVDIHVGGDGYAVLGSHDRCDLVLGSDSGIWLRHLVATCARLDDGTVGLRLIDLKTNVPFFLEDDTPQWSVTASGPFAMRLGRHVVCGFPIGPALSSSSSSSVDGDRHSTGPGHIVDEPARIVDRAIDTGLLASDHDSSMTSAPSRSIGSVPAPARREPITSFLPSAPVSQIHDLIGPSVSSNHIRVTLERGGMGASVELPSEALDAGVLLGRALNCFDGGLRRIFCEAISRAHVLLIRDRDGVYALDLCSTNGTRVTGRRIRRQILSDEGATLELGKKVTFRWHRRPPVTPSSAG